MGVPVDANAGSFNGRISVDLILDVSATVTRRAPAPPCGDHDAPAFADCGDPIDVELHEARLGRQVLDLGKVSEEALDEIWRAVVEASS